MSESQFMIALFILSVVSYLVMLFVRLHIINEVRREMNAMRQEWGAEKYERSEWQKKFEEDHPTWMTKKRTA